MRGHNGGVLSMVRGFTTFISTKQKPNAQSSAETEFLVVDDYMPAVRWTSYWLDAQGYGFF